MCRCLMAIDVVSQHGPNAQGVRSRPDRSVSLPDARETAAEMMGGLGGVTNIRLERLRSRHGDLLKQYEARLIDTSAPYDQALEEVIDELNTLEAEIRELDPPDDPPSPPMVQTWNLDDPAERKAAIEKWGGRHLDPVPDLPPGTSAMSGVEGVPGGFDFNDPGLLPGTGGAGSFLPEGLDWDDTEAFLDKVEEYGGDPYDPETWPEWALDQGSKPADEVDPSVWTNLSVGMPAPGGLGGFQPAAALPQSGGYQGAPPSVQSMLTAMSGEPGRIGKAAPEGQPPPYEPLPGLSEEQKKINKEAIEKIRKDHNLMEGLNPESKMDAAFLPEMFSQSTAQESDGYFGGAGDLMGSIVEAVPGVDPKMAGMIAAAILAAVAAGTGFGGPLVPPILAGGAALASQ